MLLSHRYAHTFTYPPRHPDYAAAWPAIVADTRRIINWTCAVGIRLSGPAGGRPLADARYGIAFTGDPLHGETDQFTLSPPRTPPSRRRRDRIRSICTTGRQPYDLAVTAVLLRLLIQLPSLVTVTSSGRWDARWASHASDAMTDRAADRAAEDLGGFGIGARPLADALLVRMRLPRTRPSGHHIT